jgi:hypothetical protein
MNETLLKIAKQELLKLHSELPFIAPDNYLLKKKIEDIINLINLK